MRISHTARAVHAVDLFTNQPRTCRILAVIGFQLLEMDLRQSHAPLPRPTLGPLQKVRCHLFFSTHDTALEGWSRRWSVSFVGRTRPKYVRHEQERRVGLAARVYHEIHSPFTARVEAVQKHVLFLCPCIVNMCNVYQVLSTA